MLRLALVDAYSDTSVDTVQALRRLRGVTCTAVVHADADIRQQSADELQTVYQSASLADLLSKHADEFDAVIIHGSVASRAKQARQAASTGKNVLLAGPPAINRDELQSVSEACRAADVRLMIASALRCRPSIAALKAALDSGKLGLPGLLRCHAWYPQTAGEDDFSWMSAMRLLELAVWIFGKSPTELFATTNQFSHDAAWPDYIQLHLGFPDHGMALLSSATTLPGTAAYETVSLIGSTGAAYADDHAQQQLLLRSQSTAAVQSGERIPTLVAQLREFQHRVTERRDPPGEIKLSFAAFDLLAAARQSLAEKQPIRLGK